jgi:histidinol dehydrogenase
MPSCERFQEDLSMASEPSILVWREASAAERERVISRNGGAKGMMSAPELVSSISALVDDVRDRGDAAVVDALRAFDKIDVEPAGLKISDAEIRAAHDRVGPQVHAAIRLGIERSRQFNEEIVRRSTWSMTTSAGAVIGEIARPIESVGLFVPSGKGSFPSVLIQIGVAAVVAGVPEITVVVPPGPGGTGEVDPATLVVADELGLRSVFLVNGPAGIAALAYGTQTIPAVRKIVGPGSPAVATAQALVQAAGVQVATGFGPTDSLIVAEGAVRPEVIAADLINEAEHGLDSSAVLVSTDRGILETTIEEVGKQLLDLPEPRRSYAEASILANGGFVLAADRDEAMAIANDYAPEHLQLVVDDPDGWLDSVRFAGTVLLGEWTSFAASNFVIGTPATLPTTGYAKAVSGVTAHTYLNRIATAHLTRDDYLALAPAIEALADHEGFPAHVASVTHRRGL